MLLIRFKVIRLILGIVRHPLSLACSLSLPVTLGSVSHFLSQILQCLPCSAPCVVSLPDWFTKFARLHSSALMPVVCLRKRKECTIKEVQILEDAYRP